MYHFPMIFAYLGPETMLPMTSVLAGMAGLMMMFGRNAWSWMSRIVRNLASGGNAQPRMIERPRRIGHGPMLQSGIARRVNEQVDI